MVPVKLMRHDGGGQMTAINWRLVVMVGALCAVAAAAHLGPVTFDNDEPDTPPKGFSFALTGQGKPGSWVVRKDDAAHGNVLVQTDADTTDYRFPVALYDDFTGRDVTVSVQFKTVSGKGDQ